MRTKKKLRRPSPTDILGGLVSNDPDVRRSPSRIIADALERRPRAEIGPGPIHTVTRSPPRQELSSTFWSLWCQHQDYLRQHSLRWMSNNHADAEDALSSAMLQAERKYARFAGSITNTRSWLTRLVHNVCMDHHRLRSRMDLMDSEAQDAYSSRTDQAQPRTPQRPEEQVSNRELMRHLELAMEQLTPTLREPLMMRCLQEMSYGEIASILAISEAAVRKRVQLARDKLRLLLGQH